MASNEQEPLLRRVPPALAVPPMLIQPGVEKLGSPVTIEEKPIFPPPSFTTARFDRRKHRMPQCIAHRGYKAKYPENTMASMKGAVKAGVHALETDVHITKDEVVVISHDATLKRCFGRPEKIIETNWEDIKDARTIAEPHEPMPRLQDILEYLAEPGLEETWLLLDIKLDNDADSIMRLMAGVLSSVSPPASKAWQERVVLGIWAAKYLPLAQKYLPGYPMMHIGFAVSYARHFFTVPNVGFNMLFPTLVAPGGRKFLQEARETYHRQVIAWTVNDVDKMEWCIRRGLDGVITDDPVKFLEVSDKFDAQKVEPFFPLTMRNYFELYRIWVWISIAITFFARKTFQPVASPDLLIKQKTQT